MSNITTMLNLASEPVTATKYIEGGYANGINGAGISVNMSSFGIQKGDFILAIHVVGEDSNETSFMELNSNSQDFTLLKTRYVSDSYDINMKVYGKIADGTETTVGFNSVPKTTSSVGAIARVYRGPKVLPKNSNSGYYLDGGSTNTTRPVWPEVGDTKQDELLIYFAATGHISGTISYPTPTDLTDWESFGASDSEDFTFGIGHKRITTETSFQANTWLWATDYTTSAVAKQIIRL